MHIYEICIFCDEGKMKTCYGFCFCDLSQSTYALAYLMDEDWIELRYFKEFILFSTVHVVYSQVTFL